MKIQPSELIGRKAKQHYNKMYAIITDVYFLDITNEYVITIINKTYDLKSFNREWKILPDDRKIKNYTFSRCTVYSKEFK